MDDGEHARFFQGSELPRALVLLALALVGWALVWHFAARTPAEAPEPEPVVTGKPAAVEPDSSPAFETVTDKSPIGFRDLAAYESLLTRARQATPADLAAQARRDVFYAHLWDQPKMYRGVPVHLLGTARRVLYYRSKLSPTGWLYEAWVVTPDGQNNPYVCVFEDAPKGLPVGPNVSERVVFNGYFLKLMKYEAGDVPRAAPLLVGRVGWTPGTPESASPNRTTYWLAAAVGLMFVFSMARWVVQLRRSLAPRRSDALGPRPRPTEEIDPEDLSAYLETLGDEGAPADPGEPG